MLHNFYPYNISDTPWIENLTCGKKAQNTSYLKTLDNTETRAWELLLSMCAHLEEAYPTIYAGSLSTP
jgi:hypothetical protein